LDNAYHDKSKALLKKYKEIEYALNDLQKKEKEQANQG